MFEVDYEKTVRELVELGGYDWVDPNFVYSPLTKNHTGVKNIEMALHCFGCKMSPKDVDDSFEKMGLDRVRHHEILTLGIKRPELQMQFPIVAHSTFLEGPNGIRFGIKLDSEEDNPRMLGGVFLSRKLPADYWFAGIRK